MPSRAYWSRAGLVALTVGGTVATAHAATSQIKLNPITVTAQRRAITADRTMAPVIVITRQEIERHPGADVPELLRLYAGIGIARSGGRGQPTSLFVDGTNSDQTLVLIDGVRINRGTLGGATLQFLDPQLIQRIEIVKGPRSALYGSGAIGGVIQIFTRRGGTGVAGTAGAGSHGTESASLHLAGRHGSDRAGLDASALYSRGFPSVEGASLDRNYHNFSGSGYVDGHIGPLKAEASILRAQGNSEYFDYGGAPRNEDFRNEVDRLRLRARPASRWRSKLLLARALNDVEQRQSPDHARTDQYSADWQNTVLLSPTQVLIAGLYGQRERVDSRVFGSSFDKPIDSGAAYAEDSVRFGESRLLLALRYTHNQGFGGYTTGNAEYGWQPSERLRFNVGVGSGYRAPSGSELYGFGGNPELNPEHSLYQDASVHYRLSAHQRVYLRLFQNRIDNLIEFTGTYPNGHNENVGHARIRGADIGYRGFAGAWSWRVGAVYHQPLNEDTGQDLLRRPRRRVTAGVDYSGQASGAHPYSVGVAALAASRRQDIGLSGGSVTDGGYALVNLHGTVALAHHLSLAVQLDNVLDKDYTTAAGYSSPGRTFFVRLRYNGG